MYLSFLTQLTWGRHTLGTYVINFQENTTFSFSSHHFKARLLPSVNCSDYFYLTYQKDQTSVSTFHFFLEHHKPLFLLFGTSSSSNNLVDQPLQSHHSFFSSGHRLKARLLLYEGGFTYFYLNYQENHTAVCLFPLFTCFSTTTNSFFHFLKRKVFPLVV